MLVVASEPLMCFSSCFCVLPGSVTQKCQSLLHVMDLSFLVCRMGNKLIVMITSQGPHEVQVMTLRAAVDFQVLFANI